MDVKIQAEKTKIREYKRYFHKFAQKNSAVLLTLLFPTFLAGWQAGKTASSGKRVKQFLKFIVFTALTNLRK